MKRPRPFASLVVATLLALCVVVVPAALAGAADTVPASSGVGAPGQGPEWIGLAAEPSLSRVVLDDKPKIHTRRIGRLPRPDDAFSYAATVAVVAETGPLLLPPQRGPPPRRV